MTIKPFVQPRECLPYRRETQNWEYNLVHAQTPSRDAKDSVTWRAPRRHVRTHTRSPLCLNPHMQCIQGRLLGDGRAGDQLAPNFKIEKGHHLTMAVCDAFQASDMEQSPLSFSGGGVVGREGRPGLGFLVCDTEEGNLCKSGAFPFMGYIWQVYVKKGKNRAGSTFYSRSPLSLPREGEVA